MYHGTSPDTAAIIEQRGFRPSTQGLLGPGVYLSRDVHMCRQYGKTILEVMVSVGKVCRADKHPELIPSEPATEARWHDIGGFDSVWVPPDCPASVFVGAHYDLGIVEEDCVWDPMRVTVLGRAEDDGDAAMKMIAWCFKEDADRLSAHSETMGECWVPFSQLKSFFIESHYRIWNQDHGKASVVVVCEKSRKLFHRHTGTRYEVYFDRMVQRNLSTRKERAIRRMYKKDESVLHLQGLVRMCRARFSMIKALRASWLLQMALRGAFCRRREK